jgi:hypothetical protein
MKYKRLIMNYASVLAWELRCAGDAAADCQGACCPPALETFQGLHYKTLHTFILKPGQQNLWRPIQHSCLLELIPT